MKALLLSEYNQLVYTNVPDPQITSDEVLIKVEACGICGSDVHGLDGSTGRRIPPIIMGHEASGIIEDVGDFATKYKKGDRVTFDSTVYCGKCFFCHRGDVNLCDNRKVIGVSCEDYRQHGAFAEYVAVPERVLYFIPEEVTFEQAAMVEPLSVALHAVNITPILINDTVIVMGSGMIGQLIIKNLKLRGCKHIIAIDIDNSKLKSAKALGASCCINSNDKNINKIVWDITANKGADVAIEAVGITSTVKTAVALLRKGGFLTLVGNLSQNIEFPLQSIVTRQIKISGSCSSNGEYDVCLDLIKRKDVNVDFLISEIAPLSDGAQWFKRLYNKEPGLSKIILKP